MKSIFQSFTLAALLISATAYAAGIVKWVDDRGITHYGDSAPANVDSKDISVSSPPSDPGPPLPRLQPNENTGKAPATEPDPKTVPDDQAQVACAQARQDLAVINRSNRIRLRAADGSVRFMTTEEIDQRRQQSQQDIDNYCR